MARYLILFAAIALLIALLPQRAMAHAHVTGCSVDLTRDGADGVEIVGPDGVPFAMPGSSVVIDDPEDFASGDYVATWSDGAVDRFTLVDCIDPGPATPENENPGPDVVSVEEILVPVDRPDPQPLELAAPEARTWLTAI